MTQNSHNAEEPGSVSKHSTPGSLALLVQEELDNSYFKKPLPVVQKQKINILKKKVLDEETFCKAIDKIIQRDFFPDVEKIKTQNAYLDAIKNNDVYSLRKIYAKYSLDNSPFTMPGSIRSTLETPIVDSLNEKSDFIEQSDVMRDCEINSKLNGKKQRLDQFFATHISEESQNFQEMIQEEERKLKEKKPWLFVENDQPEKLTGNLPLPTTEEKDVHRISDGNLDMWAYKDRNYIMFVPDGVEMSAKHKLEMAKVKPEIAHINTNFLTCPYDEEYSKEVISDIAYKQSRALEGKIGMDGKAITLDSPKVNGFSFVSTPSPMPGVDATPLMTWGQIEGAPFKLDGSDTPRSVISSGPSFKIAEQPKREKLAFQLAEKVRERHRDTKRKALENAKRQMAMSSPSVARSPLNKLNLMSPAAKRLMCAHFRNKFDVDSSLRSSYSPKCLTPIVDSPVREPSSSSRRSTSVVRTPSTPLSSARINKTPKLLSGSSIDSPEKRPGKPAIQINKRSKAADFFF